MRLTEEEIRKITLNAIEQLGEKASPEMVKKVVNETVEKLENSKDKPNFVSESTGKFILTAFGKNVPGIVAAITNSLAKQNCDIQDMSQKILGEFFTLIMIVDITDSPKELNEIQTAMKKIQEEKNIKIYIQHEDIFRTMHRV